MTLTNQLRACWSPALGASGSLLRDYTGNGNHMEVIGTSMGYRADGRLGVLHPEVANNYMRAAKSDDFRPGSGDFTLSLWVKMLAHPSLSVGACLFENDIEGGPGGRANGFIFAWSSSFAGNGILYVFGGGVNVQGQMQAGTGLLAGQWYMVGVRRVSGVASIMVNGQPAALTSGLTTFSMSQSLTFGGAMIARLTDGASFWINGITGEYGFWHRALTDAEHVELYRRGNGWLARELTGQNNRRIRIRNIGFQAAWARRQSQIIGGGL